MKIKNKTQNFNQIFNYNIFRYFKAAILVEFRYVLGNKILKIKVCHNLSNLCERNLKRTTKSFSFHSIVL